MNLQENPSTKDQTNNAWAFAANKRRRTYKSSVITACSKEAKALGIRAGMRYEEAKTLLPELRVLVYRGGHHA